MTKNEKPRVMNGNYFEITGKITFIDVKYAANGTAYTRTLMSKKSRKGDDVYDTYAFTFFGEAAEKYAETIQKGDTVNIVGHIDVDTFEKDGKKIERLVLIGRHFVKAQYSEADKGYIAADGDLPWA